MTFTDAYRYGIKLGSIGRLVRDMSVSVGDCRRGLRSAALFRLLAAGLTLDEVTSVLGVAT